MDTSLLISSASASYTVLRDLGAALMNERDRQKAAAIHVQFTEKLIDAQAQLLQVLGAVTDQQRNIPILEQRIRDLEAQRAEKERYELAKVGTEREFFAYRLRAPAELVERADEVSHFACQPCFEAGKKVVLSGNGDGFWACPVCKHGAQAEPGTPVVYATKRWRRDLLDGY